MMNFKRRAGFTILEIVIVMAIVSVLASFIVSAASIARKKGVRAKAETQIAALETALSMYESDMGDYPDTTDMVVLVKELVGPVANPYWEGPYIQFREKELVGGSFRDPWGNPYNYRKSPVWGNVGSFNVWTNGPDGNDDSSTGSPYGDDIYNW